MTFRNVALPVVGPLVAGAFALLIPGFFADQSLNGLVLAEAKKEAPRPKGAPTPVPPVAQGAPAAAAPVRTETVTYDAWTVNCRDTADGKTKKVCSATLSMIVQQQNQQVPLGAWIIARNNEGALLSVVQTPQLNVGVLITKGVELKLGNNKPHKISYVACTPQRCEGTMPMDDTTIRELIAAANGAAVVTFWKADGAEFTINIASIKGIDKAISSVR